MTETLTDRCNYSKSGEEILLSPEDSPIRTLADETLYKFCRGCTGYETKCIFYYTV